MGKSGKRYRTAAEAMDPSVQYSLAEAVAQRLELSQLTALVMDAESLTAPDNSFDAAICRLGMM